jgi:predicted permease
MSGVLVMFGVTVLQNASFTLVSRARNSGSVGFHAAAAVASNGVWLLVIRQVVTNLDSLSMMLAYLAGSVTGSVLMHVVSMRWLETGKRKVGAA